jgi:hypothetical protein
MRRTKFSGDNPKPKGTYNLIHDLGMQVNQPMIQRSVSVRSPLSDKDLPYNEFMNEIQSNASNPQMLSLIRKKYGRDAIHHSGAVKPTYINKFIEEHSKPSFRQFHSAARQNPNQVIFPESVLEQNLPNISDIPREFKGISDEDAGSMYNFQKREGGKLKSLEEMKREEKTFRNKVSKTQFRCGGKMKTKYSK